MPYVSWFPPADVTTLESREVAKDCAALTLMSRPITRHDGFQSFEAGKGSLTDRGQYTP